MTEVTRDPRLDARARRGGRPPLHPWDEWLDGKSKVIQVPSRMDARSLRSMILQTARRRGLFITTQLFRARPDWKGGTIGIRFEQAAEPPVPQRPYLPEHILDKAFEQGKVAILPEKRRPFSDDQWREYLIGEFLDRGADVAIEVDEADGLMHVVVTKRESDDDYV